MRMIKRAFFDHGGQILLVTVSVIFSKILYKKLWKSISYSEKIYKNFSVVRRGPKIAKKFKFWSFWVVLGGFRV